MRRHLVLLLAASAVFMALCPASAQKFTPKSIQFKGAPEYSDQELLSAAGLKQGDVLSVPEMTDHSQLLMDTGVFATLTFKFDGQDLVYTLTPATNLYPIRLQNLPLAPGPELDSKLHALFPLYHGKVPDGGGLMEQVRAALEKMLADEGVKATVTAVATAAQPPAKGAFVS